METKRKSQLLLLEIDYWLPGVKLDLVSLPRLNHHLDELPDLGTGGVPAGWFRRLWAR